MRFNLIEKIVQRHVVGATAAARAGDIVSIQPRHVMTHDNSMAVMKKYAAMVGWNQPVFRETQPVFTADHDIQNESPENRRKYEAMGAFSEAHGIDFYWPGSGIGHQLMCEEGYVLPGTMVVASDSHSNMYGGLGCLGTPVVRTDAAAIWATGRTWWQVPPVARVVLSGELPAGATGKDVIIALCGLFNDDQVLNHAVEFAGPAVPRLSVDERLTIANMTTEWGALAGVFPADEKTVDWLVHRANVIGSRRRPYNVYSEGRLTRDTVAGIDLKECQPDDGAQYAKELILDLSTVHPHVSGPNDVKTIEPVGAIEARRVAVNKAYIVSCVNSRLSDLREAAKVLRGSRVHPDVELYIAAASLEVQKSSEEAGDWTALLEAGARPLPSGCGPCIGLGAGLLEDGEVGISATNRNYRGRMGSRTADTYLASPAVVAASAKAGFICGPTPSADVAPRAEIIVMPETPLSTDPVDLVDGFDPRVDAHLVWCPQDNLNTDGIYAGKWTYKEDVTPEQMAEVAMENYDPDFGRHCQSGDVLVSGYNFGTGSSREQAATALKHKGLRLVIAGSFSETYKRNALNNGLVVIEAPALVDYLSSSVGRDAPTVRTTTPAQIDFEAGRIAFDGAEFPFRPLGRAAQELIVAGGIENWVREQLNKA